MLDNFALSNLPRVFSSDQKCQSQPEDVTSKFPFRYKEKEEEAKNRADRGRHRGCAEKICVHELSSLPSNKIVRSTAEWRNPGGHKNLIQ
ncbi:hypothetical protein TNCT_207601 [Trichonephila clavata]|uniref:Uncharacterized protein n=1 Tax=Trichonephila clavata TaxID=2740835 RepID=A0A8X6HQ21_TRICU|nr:hypothetical protein TNCT_207601 [Trichonephila clavata]